MSENPVMVVALLPSFPPLLQLLSRAESMSLPRKGILTYLQLLSFILPRLRAEGDGSWSVFPFLPLAHAFFTTGSDREQNGARLGWDACVKSVGGLRGLVLRCEGGVLIRDPLQSPPYYSKGNTSCISSYSWRTGKFHFACSAAMF